MKKIEPVDLHKWLYHQLEVSPVMLRRRFKLSLAEAEELFAKLIGDGLLTILTEKSERYIVSTVKLMELKLGERAKEFRDSVKHVLESASRGYEMREGKPVYLQPLCRRMEYRNVSGGLQFTKAPLYDYIENASKNRKTIFLSEELNQSRFGGLLICALADVPESRLWAGDLSNEEWGVVINSAAMASSWPGEFHSLRDVPTLEQVKAAEALIDSDCECVILDLPTNSKQWAAFFRNRKVKKKFIFLLS